jgi:hypothetical protein
LRFIDREEVARRLTYDLCIPIVREAMIAFSRGDTRQLLRSIIPLSHGRLFGIMPGALGAEAPFGAKLISVFHENFARGRQSHQGLSIRSRKAPASVRRQISTRHAKGDRFVRFAGSLDGSGFGKHHGGSKSLAGRTDSIVPHGRSSSITPQSPAWRGNCL